MIGSGNQVTVEGSHRRRFDSLAQVLRLRPHRWVHGQTSTIITSSMARTPSRFHPGPSGVYITLTDSPFADWRCEVNASTYSSAEPRPPMPSLSRGPFNGPTLAWARRSRPQQVLSPMEGPIRAAPLGTIGVAGGSTTSAGASRSPIPRNGQRHSGRNTRNGASMVRIGSIARRGVGNAVRQNVVSDTTGTGGGFGNSTLPVARGWSTARLEPRLLWRRCTACRGRNRLLP